MAIERVAIDLTPSRPGGENGGAKLLALELTKQFAQSHPSTEFILLTTSQNHDDLAALDRANVRRHCVTNAKVEHPATPVPVKYRAERVAARFLPAFVKSKLVRYVRPTQTLPPPSPLMEALGAQILFCPFTAPSHSCESTPTVCVVHDLQFMTYPQFFRPEFRAERDMHFRWACHRGVRIICPSEYVRGTVIRHGGVDPDRVSVVANTLHGRLQRYSDAEIHRRLALYGVSAGDYLLYPANFWMHKNHEMLIVAFGMYRNTNPSSRLKLVLTGAPDARQDEVRRVVADLGLTADVLFPGYVNEPDFAAILQGCKALIFPSLYEGFGMPVLEAMAMGRPVLCANRTSLPEVAGDAALYFDPRSPYLIAKAIEHICDEAVSDRYMKAAAARTSEFGDRAQMATEYWNLLEAARTSYSAALAGA